MRTEGCIFPVSICEIELGERSSRRASSRRLRPRLRRIARRRGPSPDDSPRALAPGERSRPIGERLVRIDVDRFHGFSWYMSYG